MTDDEMWNLWNSHGIDEMNQQEAIAFARAAITAHEAKQTAEPVAWRDPTNVKPGQGCTYEREVANKWPHIYSQPLYAHPQPAKREPLGDEQDRALCEAYCNTASDEYFNARPQLDSQANRRIFYAGHRKAWIGWQAAHGITKDTPKPRKASADFDLPAPNDAIEDTP
jgi:hypothetical protein